MNRPSLCAIASAEAGITGLFAVGHCADLRPLLVMRFVKRANDMLLAVVPALRGDYNTNGVVDAAEYVVWRKSNRTATGYNLRRSHSAPPPGGGTAFPSADAYDTWRTHFGQTAGSGSAASANAAVSEPATLVLLIFAAIVLCLRRRQSA